MLHSNLNLNSFPTLREEVPSRHIFSRLAAKAVVLFLFAAVGHVHANCLVLTDNIVFGNYDVFNAAPTQSGAFVYIDCNANTDATITIGPSSVSGSETTRQMRNATSTDRLNYTITKDAAGLQPWGTTGANTVVTRVPKKFNNGKFYAYARLDAGQDVSSGIYTDTLVVTITP